MSDGRTLGTLVGAVAGFFTGGAAWVSLGAAAGGLVGGLLEPKKRTETNRIDDIKVSLSKYGDGIPETWGSNIPSATCVWSTYIIELPEEPTGGKGGGVENTNYRQFIQSMWCLGRTPPAGTEVFIRKVWIDGKLNYDSSSGLSVGQALATKENPWASLALLPGFDDQLPVSLIETYEGVGNVPAFRGRICVFIFGLECPGGRIPQLQFELCVGASLVELKLPYAEFDRGRTGLVTAESIWHFNEVDNGAGEAKTFEVFHAGHDSASLVRSFPLRVDTVEGPSSPVVGAPTPLAARGTFEAVSGSEKRSLVEVIDMETGAITPVVDRTTSYDYGSLGISEPLVAACDPVSGRFAFLGGQDSIPPTMPPNIRRQVVIVGGSLIFSDPLPATRAALAFYDNTVYAVYVMPGGSYFMDLIDSDGVIYKTIAGPTGSGVDDASAASVQANGTGIFAWVRWGVSGARIYQIDPAAETWILLSDDVQPAEGLKEEAFSTSFYTNGMMAVVGPTAGDPKNYDLIRFNVVQPNAADVAEFIESQSIRSGLLADQIDVSTIDDDFWGLTLKSPASARSNIAPVLTYSALGVVEEDGLLRYFARKDKVSVATIAYQELGQVEDGSEPGDPFPLIRANAQELPRSITVTYNDPNFDYQQSTVKAMRYAVDSVSDETTTLDMAITGDRAATIAQRLLLERWVAQITRSASVSRKFAFLSAGDVITVLSEDGSYGNFMTSKITDTGALIQIECFPADAELLLQVVPGPNGYRSQQIEPLAPATRLQPVDTSILRDADDNAGFYMALSSYAATYSGGELFSGDYDPPDQSVGTVQNQAPLGSAETVLGDFSEGIVDESNLLTVAMGPFPLDTITRDALLFGSTENAAAIGAPDRWEIIKFQRAEDLGGGRYLLSGLLRGQRGTEWARGTHQVGDAFVILGDGGILRPNLGVGSIGQERFYRGVTLGRSFNSAASITYANRAEGTKPFSPSVLRKSFSGTDIVLTWSRRTRYAENFLLGVVPLGEVRERYEVDIFSDATFSTVKRTLSATSPTATYTSAMQTADFGSPQSNVSVRVYQLSEIGRGHELQETI